MQFSHDILHNSIEIALEVMFENSIVIIDFGEESGIVSTGALFGRSTADRVAHPSQAVSASCHCHQNFCPPSGSDTHLQLRRAPGSATTWVDVILGPLLFLVFINDLHNVSSVLSYILFADDSNLLISGTYFKQILKIMNDELEKITWWFKCNSLCLNVNKTNFMVFAAKNKKVVGEEPKISIENRDIERVYKTKFLGVVIDSKLNWRFHTDYIANRISKNIGIIVNVKTILNLKTAKDLYYSFIYRYLNYCCCVLHVLLICQSCI